MTKSYYINDRYWQEFQEAVSFHQELSPTSKLTSGTRKITYMSGDVINGPIIEDQVATSTSETLEAHSFPFVLQSDKIAIHEFSGLISGIMGMSPEDDSAGPLYVSYLYN